MYRALFLRIQLPFRFDSYLFMFGLDFGSLACLKFCYYENDGLGRISEQEDEKGKHRLSLLH